MSPHTVPVSLLCVGSIQKKAIALKSSSTGGRGGRSGLDLKVNNYCKRGQGGGIQCRQGVSTIEMQL